MNKHHILEYNNQFDQKHKITEYFSIEKKAAMNAVFFVKRDFICYIIYRAF